MNKSEQLMSQAIERTLLASSESEAAEQAYQQCNPGLGQKFYDDMRMHEKEAIRFERLSKECAE